MNSPILMAQKLGSLANLAASATNDFEKAAVYAAAESVAAAFNSHELTFSGSILENVEKARWSICAVVGYDVDNGRDRAQHIAAAISAASALEHMAGKTT